LKLRTLVSAALALLLGGRAFAASSAASDLQRAKNAASLGAAAQRSLFDGSRTFSSAIPVVVPARMGAAANTALKSQAAAAAPASPKTPVAPAAVVTPTSAKGISDGYIGPYPESDFVLGTGRCPTCNGPREGKWYFLDEVIATPKSGAPAIVWIGSHELLEGVTLSADGSHARLRDGTEVPFQLVPKIASNRSYWNADSLAFLRGRSLRVRGEFVMVGGVKTLVARTVWPEDFRIDEKTAPEVSAPTAEDIDHLVAADKGGAQKPFQVKVLWQKDRARDWDGKPVMGFMLNGAQGDDDESLGGHSSFFTGRMGPGGSMADWMFDNFYDMNTVSEKGIVASMVPMDKYMADLNAGQSWYRPSYLMVMVLKDDRAPLELQETFKKQYADYYSQKLKYDHTHENCAALVADPVRADGWKFPEDGKTPHFMAVLIKKLVGAAAGKEAADQVYGSLSEEPTRSFPRASFDSAGGDMLSLAGEVGAEPRGHAPTPLEREIKEDLVAVLWVRIPQIPSSRAFGRDPAGGVVDYFTRVPMDRSKWKTVPSYPRPFPPPH
jgi:hypothetical protein